MKKINFFVLLFLTLAITCNAKQWILFCSQGGMPGHAFAAFIKEDPISSKPVEIGSWGFNPKIHVYPLTTVEGNVESENNTYRSDTFLAEVDQTEWELCQGIRRKWNVEKYNFTSKNCIDFIRELAKQIKVLVWPPYSLNSPFVFITQLKAHNLVWENHSLLSYRFSLNKSTDNASSNDENLTSLGGTTPDELGKAILRALKSNDQKLWLDCLHPTETKFWSVNELRFKQFRDVLQKKGLIDWGLVSFKPSTVEWRTLDSLDIVSARRRGDSLGKRISNFFVDFTYKGKDFVGRLGPMIIQQHQFGNYFIISSGKTEDVILIPTVAADLVGGTTPEELGRIILKAVKTNNKALYKACILPNQNLSDYLDAEKGFDMIREDFPGKGLSDWSLMKFSRVTFSKKVPFGDDDGGVIQKGPFKGEQVRRDFYIEFTYKQDFVGRIGSATIVTYKGKYFIANGGGGTLLYRF